MLHLLTEEHRKKVVREYKKRVTIVFLFGIFFIVLTGMVFTLPTFLISYSNYSTRATEKEVLQKELASVNDEASAQSVKESAVLIDTLHTFSSDISHLYIIEQIIKSRPSTVSVTNFIFTPGDNGSMTVDIAGVSNSRRELVAFSDSLKSNSFFESINIPLSNFAKDKNVRFSVKLTINRKTDDSTGVATTTLLQQ